MTIKEPGLYIDFDPNEYLADPCEGPSMTQSIAKILLAKSPLHAWYAHPRLNPDYRADTDPKFDLGTAAHALLIGRGRQVVVADYPDWRTKAAQASRDEAMAAGKTCILTGQMARVERMVEAARHQLESYEGLGDLFVKGKGEGEVVAAWREGGLWYRQMIDWLTAGLFVDYKTTGLPVASHGLDRMMVGAGWHIQAAMAERGGLGQERMRYLFVVQETELPYALQVAEISEGALTMGRKQLGTAIRIWDRCMRNNVWPNYARQIVSVEYPGFAETQWLERELNEFGDGVKSDLQNIIMAG